MNMSKTPKSKEMKEVPRLDVLVPQSSSMSPFRPGRGGFGGAKLKKNANNNNVVANPSTIRRIVPAEKAELLSVARAMHGDEFGRNLQGTFQKETDAAISAIQTGIYIGWRCPEYNWDCIRVGEESMCFCGHKLVNHRMYNGVKDQASCAANECRCRSFSFVPSQPQDVGEFWLQRRPGYDPSTWRAKCRCKHDHTEHTSTGAHKCTKKSCRCNHFESSFLCAACDRHWEDHETYFETEQARVKKGMPIGEAYLPFAEMTDLRNMALTGEGNTSKKYKQIEATQSPLASSINSNIVAMRKTNHADNNTPVPFGYRKPKGSPFD